jgi:hypothetical protein
MRKALQSWVFAVAILSLELVPSAGQAGPLPVGSVEFKATGSDGDGNLSATVLFRPINGGIEITITNNETGTLAKGQAISGLLFGVGGGLGTPTAFTELQGYSYSPSSNSSWTLSSGTKFDNNSSASPPNAIDHWDFDTTSSSVTLSTVNSPVPGSGNPHYMILPASGTAGSGKSLANSNFYPFIIGPGTFFLTDSSISTKTNLFNPITEDSFINNVQVLFGTGPDYTSTMNSIPSGEGPSISPNVGATPAPPSIIMFGVGGLALAVFFARSRRTLLAAA